MGCVRMCTHMQESTSGCKFSNYWDAESRGEESGCPGLGYLGVNSGTTTCSPGLKGGSQWGILSILFMKLQKPPLF